MGKELVRSSSKQTDSSNLHVFFAFCPIMLCLGYILFPFFRRRYVLIIEAAYEILCTPFLAHDAKSLILHDFYKDLLGRSCSVEWRFCLSELYPTTAVAGMDLSRPFTSDEISSALFSMDMNASSVRHSIGTSGRPYRMISPNCSLNFMMAALT